MTKFAQRGPVIGRVFAKARPGAMPMPHDQKVCAFTKPDVFDRWSDEAGSLRAAAPKAANVIEMYDVIGEDIWSYGGGVTAGKVSEQLRAVRGQPVEIRINSGGGDMFEGIAIYNLLREHDAQITVKVIGMAASAASIIAMAGDTIEIGAAAFLMIHNCWVVAMGNRHDMAETAAFLEPFDQAMAEVYAQRSGQSIEQVAAWMDAETYMSGTVAVERGFADALLPNDASVADDQAGATARETASIRATEHALLASGMTRTQARAHINGIKNGTRGTRDAAPDHGTRDAAAMQAWADAARDSLKFIKGL